MEQWRRGLPKILVVVAAVAMMVAMPSPGEANSSPEYYQSKSTSTSTPGEAKLSSDYYRSTCPNVESIVRAAVAKKIKKTVVTIPATLRLYFHDCFVQGCDASVMIASPYNDAEKDADDNRSLAGDGFDMVVHAKAEVEKQCPGVVSCADILALAAREVVNQSGGPYWNVQFGRLDGLVSKASDVAGKLPGPDMNVKNLTEIFYKNGLSMHDMITLSGAHTVGFAHCSRFKNRLYGYNSTTPTDPSYNPTYATQLRQACPYDVGPTIAVNMDPVTPVTFDNTYFSNLAVGLGLFTSDQVLYGDGATQQTVKDFAANQTLFFEEFKISMIKLGRVGVKSGKHGEIRRDCTTFNK